MKHSSIVDTYRNVCVVVLVIFSAVVYCFYCRSSGCMVLLACVYIYCPLHQTGRFVVGGGGDCD